MLDGAGVNPADIAHFIIPTPGRHFLTNKETSLFEEILGSPLGDRAPFYGDEIGYPGGAAALIQFDHMARQGAFHSGELIAVYVEESSKWMSGGFVVRWP